MPACEGRLAQVGWPTVTPTLPTQPLGRTLPSRRPEQLDGTDQVGAVGFPDEVEHPLSSILSELLVQSARKRLLLGLQRCRAASATASAGRELRRSALAAAAVHCIHSSRSCSTLVGSAAGIGVSIFGKVGFSGAGGLGASA